MSQFFNFKHCGTSFNIVGLCVPFLISNSENSNRKGRKEILATKLLCVNLRNLRAKNKKLSPADYADIRRNNYNIVKKIPKFMNVLDHRVTQCFNKSFTELLQYEF